MNESRPTNYTQTYTQTIFRGFQRFVGRLVSIGNSTAEHPYVQMFFFLDLLIQLNPITGLGLLRPSHYISRLSIHGVIVAYGQSQETDGCLRFLLLVEN